MRKMRCSLLAVIGLLLIGASVHGQDNTLYVDKKAKIPVKQIALLYVHYPYPDELNIDREALPNLDRQVRKSLQGRLQALGYEVSDWTEGNWYISRGSYDWFGNSMPLAPLAIEALGDLRNGGNEEWLKIKKTEIAPTTALLSFGVYRRDVMTGSGFLRPDISYYNLYLTTAGQLNIFSEGKKPRTIWENTETWQWSWSGKAAELRGVDAIAAKEVILKLLSGADPKTDMLRKLPPVINKYKSLP